MDCKVVSKIISQGKNRWRLNEDGSWSILMFGSFPFQKSPGLTWKWVDVPENKVPEEVKCTLEK